MTSRYALTAVLPMLLIASTAAAQSVEARGEALVSRNCAQCHAVGHAGPSPMAAAPAFRDLNRNYPLDNLGEALAEGILTGHPAMPEFQFAPEDINAILRYLESVQSHRRSDLDSVWPDRR